MEDQCSGVGFRPFYISCFLKLLSCKSKPRVLSCLESRLVTSWAGIGRVLLLSSGSCRSAVSVSEALPPSHSCAQGFPQQVEHAAQFPSALTAEVAVVAYFDPY
ncbi:hypothetical protein EK904_001125 [Melospiza melodia maxima]|nr:hypothetical protein EK904_001125 [Melospiza melodia maxima]